MVLFFFVIFFNAVSLSLISSRNPPHPLPEPPAVSILSLEFRSTIRLFESITACLNSLRDSSSIDFNFMPFYELKVKLIIAKELTTMFIDFSHVMQFNDVLQKAISGEYLRFEPYLKNACKRFMMERLDLLHRTFKNHDYSSIVKHMEKRYKYTECVVPVGGNEGVSDLKTLVVRHLPYRLAFIANSMQVNK